MSLFVPRVLMAVLGSFLRGVGVPIVCVLSVNRRWLELRVDGAHLAYSVRSWCALPTPVDSMEVISDAAEYVFSL